MNPVKAKEAREAAYRVTAILVITFFVLAGVFNLIIAVSSMDTNPSTSVAKLNIFYLIIAALITLTVSIGVYRKRLHKT